MIFFLEISSLPGVQLESDNFRIFINSCPNFINYSLSLWKLHFVIMLSIHQLKRKNKEIEASY